ncbi:MAG: signal peptidase II [Dehalococcoidia bacterium]
MDDATAEHAPDRTHRLTYRLVRFLLVAGLVVLLDQVTKAAVRGSLSPGDAWPEGWEVIRIVHIRNTGAAFGILQGAGDFLIIAPLIAIAAIAFFLLTMPAQSRWYSIALSAILGGAVGNLIDRIRLGSVTDFIDPIYYPWSFNLADSAIVLGIIAIVVLSLFEPAAVELEEADVADGAEVPR